MVEVSIVVVVVVVVVIVRGGGRELLRVGFGVTVGTLLACERCGVVELEDPRCTSSGDIEIAVVAPDSNAFTLMSLWCRADLHEGEIWVF